MILVDGDMLVYRVGFACDEETKTLHQTLDNYLSEMIVDLSDHYTTSTVFLTGRAISGTKLPHPNHTKATEKKNASLYTRSCSMTL